jgi:hypothetical protein
MKREGRLDVMVIRGRRRKLLLGDVKEVRGYRKLKEEALDRTQWRTRFIRGCGPVAKKDCILNVNKSV